MNLPDLDHSTSSFPQINRSIGFVLAIVLPLSLLWVRFQMPADFGTRPMMIIFIPAIITVAILGGLWPGLLATTISSVCAAYLLPPVGQFQMTGVQDAFQLSILALSGILASGLAWLLHRIWARDIDRRAQLEAALASQAQHLEAQVAQRTAQLTAAESRFRSLVDQSLTGINIIQGGYFRYVNQAFADIFGFTSPDEIIDKVPVADLVAPECRDLVTNTIRKRTTGDIDSSQYHFTGLRKDGRRVEVEIFGRRIDYEGQSASIGIVVDVTHRLEIEREREAMLQDLARAKEAAEAANVAKSAFLSNMSHEIRTPLNAITGMAHLIRHSGLSPQQAEKMDKLEVASRHLLEVINSVLDLSKIEAGKLILERQPVDLDALTGNVMALIQERADYKGLQLKRNVVPIHFPLLGDVTRLQQALLNYAANAVKFTESGSVTLRVVLLEEDANSALFRFEVADTGIGIAPDALVRLFAAFEQADSTLTRKYGGTGLGLAITKEIAHLMGGEAGAESHPGIGSTFWFSARLQKAAEAHAPLTSEANSPQTPDLRSFTGVHILVVEDEPINREIAQSLLEELGMQVSTAADGVKALEALSKVHFDLVFMDMQMPEMDGLEAIRRIRANKEYNRLPIVAMTANAFAEDKESCFAAGADDFLTKPVEPEVLSATLVKWLTADNFAWSPRYSVGVSILDLQHRKLLGLCRDAARCLEGAATEDGALTLDEILDQMRAYAEEHFRTEEHLLAECGYPNLAEQRAEHEAYVHALSEFLFTASISTVEAQRLRDYLLRWWLDHILESDMAYKPFLAPQLH